MTHGTLTGRCFIDQNSVCKPHFGLSQNNRIRNIDPDAASISWGDDLSAKKAFFVTSDIGVGKGGIQAWGHYIQLFLDFHGIRFSTFKMNSARLKQIMSLIGAWFSADIFILLDWRKTFFVLPAFFMRMIGLRHARFTVIIHGDEIIKPGKFGFFLKWLVRRRAAEFICNSKAVSCILEESRGRTADHICYPFIDIHSLIAKAEKRKKSNQFRIVSITRLAKRKNIISVVRSFPKLIADGYNVDYTIIGDGPDKDMIAREISALRIGKRVHLLGRVDEDKKCAILSQADLFILPSVFDQDSGSIEGFGIVFIEANAFGVPVVSGNTGGMVEAVRNGITGFHCNGTEADIYRKITKCMHTQFDREYLRSYAVKFDYKSQGKFFRYIFGE